MPSHAIFQPRTAAARHARVPPAARPWVALAAAYLLLAAPAAGGLPRDPLPPGAIELLPRCGPANFSCWSLTGSQHCRREALRTPGGAGGVRLVTTGPAFAAHTYWATVQARVDTDLQAGDVGLLRFTARTSPANVTQQPRQRRGPAHAYIMPVFQDDSPASGYMKSLDGLQTTSDAEQNYSIPFTLVIGDPPGNATIQFELGFQQEQSVDITRFSLLLWRKGSGVNASQLPSCCADGQYPGRAASAAWRTEALARIDRVRRGSLTVSVAGGNGAPVRLGPAPRAARGAPRQAAGADAAEARRRSGACCAVNATMERPAFRFGSAVNADAWGGRGTPGSADARQYREWFLRLFDTAVFEGGMKWPAWDDPALRNRSIALARELLGHGVRVRGHNLVWPSCGGSGKVPTSVCAYDVAHANESSARRDLEAAIEAHIAAEVGTLRSVGCCEEFDVVNEPYSNVAIVDALQAGNTSILRWLNATRAANPSAGRRINDEGVCSGLPALDGSKMAFYDRYLAWLLANGDPGLLTGVGCESHLREGSLPGPEALIARYNQLAGLHPSRGGAAAARDAGGAAWTIRVTEFDIVTGDLQLYADYLRDLLIAAYSTAAVDGFLMWGFMDGHHWLHSAPLFNSDWSPKPGLAVWQRYVLGEWRSSAAGHACPGAGGGSGAAQWLSPPMHHGTYRVEVRCPDGRSGLATGVVLEGAASAVTVPVN